MLYGVTVSGYVRFKAILQGTPSSSILIFGSGVITVRAEKSTLFPIKLPLIRPSFALSLLQIDLIGLPDLCVAYMTKRFMYKFNNTFIWVSGSQRYTTYKEYRKAAIPLAVQATHCQNMLLHGTATTAQIQI